jgi:hypothetical protein
LSTAATAAPAIFSGNTFRLADRIRIQCDKIRQKDFIIFGRLTAVHWAAPRDTTGLSQSRPRYSNVGQVQAFEDAVAKKILSARQADALKPFSEKQNILWQSTTLDWLDAKRGPLIARSKDQRDWLLPQGLTALPDIPDPRFTPAHALSVCSAGAAGCSGCIAPRIPQLYTGCPIVGDRVEHRITARNGYVMGILHPVLELSIVAWAPDGQGHFLTLRGAEDNVERTRPALLIDDEDRGFFVGGIFA